MILLINLPEDLNTRYCSNNLTNNLAPFFSLDAFLGTLMANIRSAIF